VGGKKERGQESPPGGKADEKGRQLFVGLRGGRGGKSEVRVPRKGRRIESAVESPRSRRKREARQFKSLKEGERFDLHQRAGKKKRSSWEGGKETNPGRKRVGL